jgi:hypothetical protein
MKLEIVTEGRLIDIIADGFGAEVRWLKRFRRT